MNLGLGDQSRAGSFLDTILQMAVPGYGLMRNAQGLFDESKRAGTLFAPFNNQTVGTAKGLFGMDNSWDNQDAWGQPGAYNNGSGGFAQPEDMRSPGLFGTGLFADVGQANSIDDNLSVWNEDGSYTHGSDVDVGGGGWSYDMSGTGEDDIGVAEY